MSSGSLITLLGGSVSPAYPAGFDPCWADLITDATKIYWVLMRSLFPDKSIHSGLSFQKEAEIEINGVG
jgi:hypothetical protein